MTSEFVTGRRAELERTAAKYTDKPAECVAALRGDIITDIAEGLALIGVTGGLIDILEYAAELAYAELPESLESDLSQKRGIMPNIQFSADGEEQSCSTEPCPTHITADQVAATMESGIRFIHRAISVPAFTDQTQAALIASHAIDYLLTAQATECPNQCEPMEFGPVDPASTTAHEDFARSLQSLMGIAWTHLTYKHYMPTSDPKNALRGALVLPYWAAAMPRIGALALQMQIPVIAAMWDGLRYEEPKRTPSGHVLAIISKDHMAPSLALQNYTVESVHPFTTKAAA